MKHVNRLTTEEVNRKLLHILAGISIPAGIIYIPALFGVSTLVPTFILGGLLLLSIGLEWFRFKSSWFHRLFFNLFGYMMRSEEERKFTGATYIFASSFLCSAIFYKTPEIAAIVLCIFIFGDAVAAVAGLSIGRIKIGKKSLEGSIACFLISIVLLYLVFPHVPMFLDSYGKRLPIGFCAIIAFIVTIMELFPVRIGKHAINDNLSVPLVAGFFFKFFVKFF